MRTYDERKARWLARAARHPYHDRNGRFVAPDYEAWRSIRMPYFFAMTALTIALVVLTVRLVVLVFA